MGLPSFLSLIPLNLSSPDLSAVQVWLFPIIRKFCVGQPLAYFTNVLLPATQQLAERAAKVRVGLSSGVHDCKLRLFLSLDPFIH